MPESYESANKVSASQIKWDDLDGKSWEDLLVAAADEFDVPRKFALALHYKGEKYDPRNKTSPKGAHGQLQLMPGTFKEMAEELGIENPDIKNPEHNIRTGVAYFAKQLKKYGDPKLAYAAYNAGPGAVDKHGGVPPYKETQDYVRRTSGEESALHSRGLPSVSGRATGNRAQTFEPVPEGADIVLDQDSDEDFEPVPAGAQIEFADVREGVPSITGERPDKRSLFRKAYDSVGSILGGDKEPKGIGPVTEADRRAFDPTGGGPGASLEERVPDGLPDLQPDRPYDPSLGTPFIGEVQSPSPRAGELGVGITPEESSLPGGQYQQIKEDLAAHERYSYPDKAAEERTQRIIESFGPPAAEADWPPYPGTPRISGQVREGTKNTVKDVLLGLKYTYDQMDAAAPEGAFQPVLENIREAGGAPGQISFAGQDPAHFPRGARKDQNDSVSRGLKAMADKIDLDPAYLETDGFLEDIARMIPQVVIQIVTALTARGVFQAPFAAAERIVGLAGEGAVAARTAAGVSAGGIASMGMMWAQIVGAQVEDLKAQGVPEDRAFLAAVVNASIQAPLEKIGLSKIMSGMKAASGEKVTAMLESFMTEGFTEYLQKYPEVASSIWAKNPDASISEQAVLFIDSLPETHKDALYEGLVGAVVGGGFTGAGQVAKSILERMGPKTIIEPDEVVAPISLMAPGLPPGQGFTFRDPDPPPPQPPKFDPGPPRIMPPRPAAIRRDGRPITPPPPGLPARAALCCGPGAGRSRFPQGPGRKGVSRGLQ